MTWTFSYARWHRDRIIQVSGRNRRSDTWIWHIWLCGISAHKFVAKTLDSGNMAPYNDGAFRFHFHPRAYGRATSEATLPSASQNMNGVTGWPGSQKVRCGAGWKWLSRPAERVHDGLLRFRHHHPAAAGVYLDRAEELAGWPVRLAAHVEHPARLACGGGDVDRSGSLGGKAP